MKIKDLLRSVANLVEQRTTIDHGSIRCLWSQKDVDAIESAEGCDEVETGTIGDDELAAELSDLADDGDRIADLDLDDLVKLEEAYRGPELDDYLDRDAEDELSRLEALIEAAWEIV